MEKDYKLVDYIGIPIYANTEYRNSDIVKEDEMTKGMMDGWHGDEMLCWGDCGLCEECEEKAECKADEQYQRWCYQQLQQEQVK